MTIIVRTHVSHHGDEMTTTRTKLTRQEAAQRLQVSESTLDRMIRRGDLAVEREGHGSRYRIWVLLDNDGEQPSYSANGHNADSRDYSRATTADKIEQAHYGTDYSDDHELTALRAEVRSLRELSDYRAELLKDSEWRYHELLQQLNMCQEQLKLSQETTATLARALLAPASMPRFLHHNAGVGGHLAGRPRRCLVEVLPWEWPDTLGQDDLIGVRI